MKRVAAAYGLVALALALVWAVEVWVVPYTDPYLTNVLLRIGFNVVSVLGLSLVLGFTGQFSLGHAGFMAVGAYGSAVLNMHAGLPPPVAMVAGGLVASVAGLVVGVPSLRLSGDYLAVVTLGFNQIIIVIIQNTPILGQAAGLTGVPVATSFGWTFTFVILAAVTLRNLLDSPHGRAFEAVRDNEIATRSLGIDTTRVKVTAFVIGAFWAGVAGSLVGFNLSSIFPSQFQFDRSIELVAMVVLGGSGSLSGPVLAAVVLTVLPELLRDIPNADRYRMLVYSALLVVMMVLRPRGFLGSRELSDVLLALWRRLRPPREAAGA